MVTLNAMVIRSSSMLDDNTLWRRLLRKMIILPATGVMDAIELLRGVLSVVGGSSIMSDIGEWNKVAAAPGRCFHVVNSAEHTVLMQMDLLRVAPLVNVHPALVHPRRVIGGIHFQGVGVLHHFFDDNCSKGLRRLDK